MRKKFLSNLFIIGLSLSCMLTGCSKNKSVDTKDNSNVTTEAEKITTEEIVETAITETVEVTEETTIAETVEGIDEAKLSETKEKIAQTNVGDIIEYGNYNGNTEWIVLAKEDNRILLVTKDIVEVKKYHEKLEEVTWETCDIRKWLNEEYIKSAFTPEEKSLIMTTHLENKDNDEYSIEGGNDTEDKVFLLSIDEANNYFTDNDSRIALNNEGTATWWFLRSPGLGNRSAADVKKIGVVYPHGDAINNDFCGIRPAMWISVE